MSAKARTSLRGASLFLFTFALVVSAAVAAPAPAALAVSATSFNAGHIISDSEFYNGSTMNSSQIQSFLEQRVPRCTIGDSGRTAGTAWGSTTISSYCLRNFTMVTSSKTANAYCGAYSGSARETAAQIIAKVGQACGISQKVLLVMLEKEQSLVQDTWPTVRQFDVAMGYGCPDSGPNYSANCDSNYYGFQNQVYRAAWQLKVYRALPNSYNYKAYQWNTIQWHPNPACGTSAVYIENSATAALYIYTPYRPNQAALNAGWGTGDGCSSYGNRNFYLQYNTWFGSSVVIVDSRVQDLYRDQKDDLGEVLGAATVVKEGISQEFERGTLYWAPGIGAYAVRGGFTSFFKSLDGPNGFLGFPVENEVLIAGGSRQKFQFGAAYWSEASGLSTVFGGISSRFDSLGGAGSFLGFPLGGEVSENGGVRQEFQGGTAYWSAASGIGILTGGFKNYFLRNDGPKGAFGFPVGDEQVVEGGTKQEFQNATAYWSASSGVGSVYGGIRSQFNSMGGVNSYLGFPVGGEVSENGGVRQEFQGGTAYWSAGSGLHFVKKDLSEYFESIGGAGGFLGYPTSEQSSIQGGYVQEFQNGTLLWHSATEAGTIFGGIRSKYLSLGGAGSFLGFPLGGEVSENGGVRQEFQGGTAYWSAASGIGILTGGFKNYFLRNDGPKGAFGFPVGDEQVVEGGTKQEFQNATAYWSASSGVGSVYGGIRSQFNSMGGVNSYLGFPVGGEVSENGGVRQEFQGGTVNWNPTRGVWIIRR